MSTSLIELRTEDRVSNASARRSRGKIPERVDVAIIGSGLGGLTAAANLAQRGLSVAVFEPHYVAGGCATQFVRGKRSSRYRFDVGLHYIGDCGHAGQIPTMLREVGVTLDYAPLDPDGFDTLLFPDLEFRIPANVETYRERLVVLFPHQRRAIDRYIRLLEQVTRAGKRLQGRSAMGLADAFALLPDLFALGRNQGRTIVEVLDAFGVRDPKLRAILVGQNGDYGVPPAQASAFLHFGLAGHYFEGAFYPKGGGQRIADALSERIEACGGTIHLRRGVERILVEGDVVRGVVLEEKAGCASTVVRARTVLSNADLRMTLEHLVGIEHLPSSWVERTRGFKMASAIFMTFLGVRGDLAARGMRPANYWQFDSYDMNGFYRDDDRAMRVHGCYITSATAKDPENARHHAPDGISNVEVLAPVPPVGPRWGVDGSTARAYRYKDDGAYRAAKAAIEEDLIARFDRVFPGVASDIVYRESATPVTHHRFTRATDGGSYGLAGTPAQFMKRRPGYRGPLGGLYLCGASTSAGHGVLGAMLGGRQAAMCITDDIATTRTTR